MVLKAGNDEVILTSELYTTKAACTAGIESVRKNASVDAVMSSVCCTVASAHALPFNYRALHRRHVRQGSPCCLSQPC